jgi:hypothetical protein
MNRNVISENAPRLRFHVLSFPWIEIQSVFEWLWKPGKGSDKTAVGCDSI